MALCAKNAMNNNINVNLWRNQHFKSCPAGAKYLYLYLLTSPHRNRLGLFSLPLEYVAFDAMDGDEDLVNEAMAVLESKGFVSYDNNTKMLYLERQNFYDMDITYSEVVDEIMSQPYCPSCYDLVSALQAQSVIDKDEAGKLKAILDMRKKEYEIADDLCRCEDTPSKNPPCSKDLYSLAVDISKFRHNDCECVKTAEGQPAAESKPADKEQAVEPVVTEESSATEAAPTEESAPAETTETVSDEEPKKAKTRKKAASTEYEKEFEENVWPLYPRHIGKGLAMKAYSARRKANELTLAEAVEACQNYNQYCVAHNVDKNYIKHPSTFFGPTHPYEDFFTKNLEQEQVNVTAETQAHMDELNRAFERFMAEYPKKEGLVDAKNNFMMLVEDNNYTVDDIIQAAKNYAIKCNVDKTAYGYIKKASTFLDTNTRPFVDYVNMAQGNTINTAVDAYDAEDDELPTFDEEPAEQSTGQETTAVVTDDEFIGNEPSVDGFDSKVLESMSPENKETWDKLNEITQTVVEDKTSFGTPDDNDMLEDFGADEDESPVTGNGFGVSSWGTGFNTAPASAHVQAPTDNNNIINPMEDEYPF